MTLLPLGYVTAVNGEGQIQVFLRATAVAESLSSQPAIRLEDIFSEDNASIAMDIAQSSLLPVEMKEPKQSSAVSTAVTHSEIACEVAPDVQLATEESVDSDTTAPQLSLPSAIPWTPSTLQTKVECALCGELVESTRRHIYGRHLQAKNLFECAKCDFCSAQHAIVVRRHGLAAHGDFNVVVPRLALYAQKYNELFLKCFPGLPTPSLEEMTGSEGFSRQQEGEQLKLRLRRVEGDALLKYEPVSTVAVHRRQSDGRFAPMMKSKKLPPTTTADVSEKKLKHQIQNSATCMVCNEAVHVQYRKQHVLLKHLCVADMYQCSLCDYKSASNRSSVRAHISKAHSSCSADVVVNESRHRQLYENLRHQCFPFPQGTSSSAVGANC